MESIEGIVRLLHIKDDELICSMEYDDEQPDIVFVSEHIYRNRRYHERCFEYYKYGKALLVFVGGEAVYPDLNIFDYVIGYSKKLVDNDRISRIPPNLFFEKTLEISDFRNEISFEKAQELVKGRRFCNFIYSNSMAHPMRDRLFYEVSKYKRVESLGKHLNNTGMDSSRDDKRWGPISVELKSNYKFSIASENAMFEGYTSEKLLSTFMAHSIPIYWGNPYVSDEYNEKAFINCNNFPDFESLISAIKEIDENDDLWAKIVSEPWQTRTQIEQMCKEIDEYEYFIKKILSSDNREMVRRPSGTFVKQYSDFFFRGLIT